MRPIAILFVACFIYNGPTVAGETISTVEVQGYFYSAGEMKRTSRNLK